MMYVSYITRRDIARISMIYKMLSNGDKTKWKK